MPENPKENAADKELDKLAIGKPDDGKDALRCPWGRYTKCKREYHDDRWCKPVHDDNELFALLVLETMSVGLSFDLILRREDLIRKACDGLDPAKCAQYGDMDEARLMQADGLIHNKLKVRSIGNNARAFLKVREEFGSFDTYIWNFVEGDTVDHNLTRNAPPIAEDSLSRAVSKDLKKRGFSFMGPVITYSYLQAIGIVNDHMVDCPWR